MKTSFCRFWAEFEIAKTKVINKVINNRECSRKFGGKFYFFSNTI